MRKIGKFCYYVFISVFFISCQQQKTNHYLILIKQLDYSSASAIEYHDGRLYIMGDDTPNMIILDTNFQVLDSVPLLLHSGSRIPKDIKPDLEASAISVVNNETVIYFFGSGSLDPYRNAGWKYNIRTKAKDNIYLQPLYSKTKKDGIAQLNIEGAAFLDNYLILVNRGNKGYTQNQLIILNREFWKIDTNFRYTAIPFAIQKDTALFKGVSGLTYADQSDKLIMTVSTEDTRNAYDDGTIGKSYLWIINKISGKLSSTTIKPDIMIDLEEIDPQFKGQKIESATVIEETKNFIRLVLVADNDDGSSTIFKVGIEKE